MDVDRKGGGEELKIKGQADAERRRAKPNSDEDSKLRPSQADLAQRENELKERALRNKVHDCFRVYRFYRDIFKRSISSTA
ncbi:hypothetical protein LENED_005252 [Lentinula edodes]|uniref:Uncharacterized protein n=1 Tax=Lentinula edodes TaxID=5353 RepID=A0A1Q3E8M5_LENED|nr:hypothetical protein LENED_005252 [Lentinula edodes]